MAAEFTMKQNRIKSNEFENNELSGDEKITL